MHDKLQEYARNEIKQGLAQCTEKQQHFFKRMYSHKDLSKSINDVVDDMPESKLENAMDQVIRTLAK